MASLLQAKPETLEIDMKRLVVIVVNMQNAFVSKGGMFDALGFDISIYAKIIEPIKKITEAARATKVKVAYATHRLSHDLRETGPNSPFWYQKAATVYREQPEMRDRLIARGTWGAEIIDELKPHDDDILVETARFSAFAGTDLDRMLKTHDIRYVAFTGQTLNVSVQASLIDACHLEYFPILIADAAATIGPPSRREETIYNVETCFGWVTTTESFLKALQ